MNDNQKTYKFWNGKNIDGEQKYSSLIFDDQNIAELSVKESSDTEAIDPDDLL